MGENEIKSIKKIMSNKKLKRNTFSHNAKRNWKYDCSTWFCKMPLGGNVEAYKKKAKLSYFTLFLPFVPRCEPLGNYVPTENVSFPGPLMTVLSSYFPSMVHKFLPKSQPMK